jgi:hypothetical protein
MSFLRSAIKKPVWHSLSRVRDCLPLNVSPVGTVCFRGVAKREEASVAVTETPMAAWHILTLLIAVVGGRLAVMMLADVYADDAFITYRIARNVADGLGFVYNVGERVQGSTSPFFVGILALLAGLFGSDIIPILARALGTLAEVGSLMMLIRLLAPLHPAGAMVAVGFFSLFPRSVFISTLGMEAPIVVVLMLVSNWSLSCSRPWLFVVSVALLVLTRIDAILWVVVLFVTDAFVAKRVKWKWGMLGLVLPAIWLLFSHFYFGSILPHTITAKATSWNHLFPAFDPLRVLRGYFPFHGIQNAPMVVQISVMAMFLFPPMLSLINTFRRRDRLVVFPAFFFLYSFGFCFARVLMVDWYYLPAYTAYFVSLGSAASAVLEHRHVLRGERPTRCILVAILVLCSISLVWGISRWQVDPGDLFRHEHEAMGDWLALHAGVGESILLEPIGYVGWKSRLYVHDAVGLVSPQVISQRNEYPASNAWFLSYVRCNHPDYILLQFWEIAENKLFLGYGDQIFHDVGEKQWFDQHYREQPVSRPNLGGLSVESFKLYVRNSSNP